MATFNPMQASLSGATATADPLGLDGGGHSLPMEAFEPELNFDDAILDSVHAGHLHDLSFNQPYDFDAFATTFEDPFPYPGARPYDGVAIDGERLNGDEDSPRELDNKLLGFCAPVVKAALVCDAPAGDAGQLGEVGMSAELYGMFFVAEDVFGSDSSARPLELTCYRRNLWQCTGQITIPRNFSAVVDDQGRHVPIVDFVASISAFESIEGKPTEIISIPWKNGAAAAATAAAAAAAATSAAVAAPTATATATATTTTTAPAAAPVTTPGTTPATALSAAASGGAEEAKATSNAPPMVALDLAAGQDLDGSRASVPVAWRRLQFKHATANNGRRKGLQQHYVVQINLLGRAKDGDLVKIAHIQSSPVIVRGRSPRNFDSKKDVPLTAGDKRVERRGTDASASSVTSLPHSSGAGTVAGTVKAERGDHRGDQRGSLTQSMQRYHSLGTIQQPSDWMAAQAVYQQHGQTPAKRLAMSPNQSRPPIPSWSGLPEPIPPNSCPAPTHHSGAPATSVLGLPVNGSRAAAPGPAPVPTLPINLSLSEDERSPNRSGSGSDSMQSPQFSKLGVPGGQAGNLGAVETVDMLYEYFPLTLDDWMPPVDAIYRPHIIHHTIVPPEVQAQQTRSKTKRYFTD